ncbi:hypothetical protein [Shewanella psychrotolerans]|uniref:hypothetical protein n=1 Tax=Shewanella psychrotolerans TaxID=2864206 RepID=UPI001C660049|nr:hypothetical protein [Shewanella psychrotolerans]QYK02039.1 hypothetical protein K0I62_03420 [Shewanella psychrotolerans]
MKTCHVSDLGFVVNKALYLESEAYRQRINYIRKLQRQYRCCDLQTCPHTRREQSALG